MCVMYLIRCLLIFFLFFCILYISCSLNGIICSSSVLTANKRLSAT
ncbi:unnamed protein product [Acanthoscelides obtectus]|uniref:Uncharacterized protein n=1 Tax=Acanthoscelides obtectus TaxID=200917 RepID=A0A9P0JTI2_ACAOB|nr:unnamed protein product [Acanthoscelides obtectus]CAK1668908.1 hypothetical protein AOBTE_LOCUS26683 [Acanthoscelides obtectus]